MSTNYTEDTADFLASLRDLAACEQIAAGPAPSGLVWQGDPRGLVSLVRPSVASWGPS